MSVRMIMLGLAACTVAAPALAATTTKTKMPMHHSMAMHTSMSHKGHMMGHMSGHTMGHMGHGSPVSADNSADELNARSLKNAQGMMAAPAPAMPAPAPAPAGGT